MASRRQRKVAELLHKELSLLLQHETKDPRVGFITVTGVDISPDLKLARVYVSVLGDKADAKETIAGLTNATGYFRYKLGQSLSLRHVPDLVFKLDTSLEHGLRIESLLDTIREEATNETQDATEVEESD
jgi:ribosome-binding factor A